VTTPMSAPQTNTRAAGMVDRVRRAAVPACSLEATPVFKTSWRCRHVCSFRYADDMCSLVEAWVPARERSDRARRGAFALARYGAPPEPSRKGRERVRGPGGRKSPGDVCVS
jgi:hypothetical protein